MKKLFIISILAGLLLPAFVFGAISYERNPAGNIISNPVSFDVAFDNWEEMKCNCGLGVCNFWSLEYICVGGYCEILSDFWISTSTQNFVFSENLPIGIYGFVTVICSYENNCENDCWGGITLESNNYNPIFEVVEEAPTGIFTIGEGFISDITDYIQELFAGSGLYPLVALIIGLPLAFWSIEKIVDLKDKKERKKRKLEMLKEFKTKKADWL